MGLSVVDKTSRSMGGSSPVDLWSYGQVELVYIYSNSSIRLEVVRLD